jgi:hypothetical protein
MIDIGMRLDNRWQVERTGDNCVPPKPYANTKTIDPEPKVDGLHPPVAASHDFMHFFLLPFSQCMCYWRFDCLYPVRGIHALQ